MLRRKGTRLEVFLSEGVSRYLSTINTTLLPLKILLFDYYVKQIIFISIKKLFSKICCGYTPQEIGRKKMRKPNLLLVLTNYLFKEERFSRTMICMQIIIKYNLFIFDPSITFTSSLILYDYIILCSSYLILITEPS